MRSIRGKDLKNCQRHYREYEIKDTLNVQFKVGRNSLSERLKKMSENLFPEKTCFSFGGENTSVPQVQ